MPFACGSCTLCIDACPTGALDEPGVLDSTKCLSYWTQAAAPIPEEYREPLGAQVYGCDICQDVCPWNRGNREASRGSGAARRGRASRLARRVAPGRRRRAAGPLRPPVRAEEGRALPPPKRTRGPRQHRWARASCRYRAVPRGRRPVVAGARRVGSRTDRGEDGDLGDRVAPPLGPRALDLRDPPRHGPLGGFRGRGLRPGLPRRPRARRLVDDSGSGGRCGRVLLHRPPALRRAGPTDHRFRLAVVQHGGHLGVLLRLLVRGGDAGPAAPLPRRGRGRASLRPRRRNRDAARPAPRPCRNRALPRRPLRPAGVRQPTTSRSRSGSVS